MAFQGVGGGEMSYVLDERGVGDGGDIFTVFRGSA
jgi:hypothetical protein